MTGWQCPGCGRCYSPMCYACTVCGQPTQSSAGTLPPMYPEGATNVPLPPPQKATITCGQRTTGDTLAVEFRDPLGGAAGQWSTLG